MSEKMPAEIFHPGEHLRDELEARGWSQVEFAEIIMRPVGCVNQIINGKRGISVRTAWALGAALGTGGMFWMNLQTDYLLWKTPSASPDIAKRAKEKA